MDTITRTVLSSEGVERSDTITRAALNSEGEAMLHENENVRQIPGDPPRRWFSDEFFELIVWFAPDASIFGFQLCYDIGNKPRALTWLRDSGYTHDGIDDGDTAEGANKASPILVPDGIFNTEHIAARFAAAAGGLPHDIRELVLEKTREFKQGL